MSGCDVRVGERGRLVRLLPRSIVLAATFLIRSWGDIFPPGLSSWSSSPGSEVTRLRTRDFVDASLDIAEGSVGA